jgi:glutaredoxin-like YruB-family protein
MRTVWLVGLLLFCAVASGFILVRGRGEDAGPGGFAASLADHAEAVVEGAASRLGAEEPEAAEPDSAAAKPPPTFYRYTDETGTVRFVSSLSQVPKALRASARPVSNDRVQRTASLPGSATARKARRPVREEAPAFSGSPEVVVYSTSWCGWCRKTMTFLRNEGVDFENRDIEADEAWRDELIEKTGGTSIPVVEIDGQIIRGYDPQRMAKLLRSS